MVVGMASGGNVGVKVAVGAMVGELNTSYKSNNLSRSVGFNDAFAGPMRVAQLATRESLTALRKVECRFMMRNIGALSAHVACPFCCTAPIPRHPTGLCFN
jgi:hypothetical protein